VNEECSVGGRRIASNGWKKSAVEVFDVDERRTVFSQPHLREDPANASKRNAPMSLQPEFERPTISVSGRTVIDARSKALWNVNTSRVLWRAKPYERVMDLGDGEHFNVIELWNQLWNGTPSAKYWTRAVRSSESSGLIVRTVGTLVVDPRLWNSSKTLGIGHDGSVYRLPLPVNWPLLALCQSILALPLILLWALLRYRRRRAARRQPAVAIDSVVTP
jgi:hypothetical protein